MSAFYNEFEPFAAAWLRELIKEGAIADGEVSESDMWDVVPSELVRFNQVHLCAGIGGWSHALRLAGWPDDRPVWTVSLPCQPFSAAGKGAGLADERGQLAEAFFWLAGVCRPQCIFGEQVEAAIRHDWLDVVASSLESIGYTVGAAAFPASSVGAFHIRQRLYWVAYTEQFRWSARGNTSKGIQIRNEIKEDRQQRKQPWFRPGERIPACGVADAEHSERGAQGYGRNDFDSKETGRQQGAGMPGKRGATGIVGDAELSGFEVRNNEREKWNMGRQGRQAENAESRGATNGYWRNAEWIPCRDGKYRPIQRATQSEVECIPDGIQDSLGLVRLESGQQVFSPLIQKTKNRVGRLKGYGNAIVVQAAAEFIKAFMGVVGI